MGLLYYFTAQVSCYFFAVLVGVELRMRAVLGCDLASPRLVVQVSINSITSIFSSLYCSTMLFVARSLSINVVVVVVVDRYQWQC